MFNVNGKISGRAIARRVTATLLVAMTLAILGSGTWNAQASTLGQGKGSAPSSPQATCPAGGQCFADVTSANPFYAFINRIYQQGLVTGYACGGAGEQCDANNRPYYRPNNEVSRQQMAKFIDNARHLGSIDIEQASGDTPIQARNDTGTAISASSNTGQALTAVSSSQLAIYAQTTGTAAVLGYSTGAGSIGLQGDAITTGVKGTGSMGVLGVTNVDTGTGVYGETSGSGAGVYGITNTGTGVIGYSTEGPSGVYGSSLNGNGLFGNSENGSGIFATSGSGYAGYFGGDVHITGVCCSMAEGTTRIDDPTDPANKYLNQSLVQSPDMTTVLNGNVVLDSKGEATVTVDSWVEASNKDFRYQLTSIGAPGPNLYVAQELHDKAFKIAGGQANTKVSWQVTGVRQDPYATSHPIQTEQDKPANEQGKYIYPAGYNQPATNSIDYEKVQKSLVGTQKP